MGCCAGGESSTMSNDLGSTAVAAILLLATAASVVYGSYYSAIAQADKPVRLVQQWARASQLSQTAEPSTHAVQLGQESSLSAAPAPSVGNLPPHSGTAAVLEDQEV